MIEIERKFRLTPEKKEEIEKQLQADYGPIKPVRQIDEVFLQGIDSFADFKQGMPIARLRTEGETTSLAYKRRLNGGGDMVEHELIVESADTMRAILEEMDYRQVTVVDKVRLEAKVGEMALALDVVRDLGDFMEIEIVANGDRHLDIAEQQIMSMAATFGLTEEDIEPNKYDKLIAESQRNN